MAARMASKCCSSPCSMQLRTSSRCSAVPFSMSQISGIVGLPSRKSSPTFLPISAASPA
jgi:hypothetical protein